MSRLYNIRTLQTTHINHNSKNPHSAPHLVHHNCSIRRFSGYVLRIAVKTEGKNTEYYPWKNCGRGRNLGSLVKRIVLIWL